MAEYLWTDGMIGVRPLAAGRAEIVVLRPTTVGQIQATMGGVIGQLQYQLSLLQDALRHYQDTPVHPSEEVEPGP